MSTPVPTTGTEPGYLTTEFWGTLGGSLATEGFAVYVAFGGAITPAQKGAVLALMQTAIVAGWGVYGVIRTLRKNTAQSATAAVAVARLSIPKPPIPPPA